jgi:hypothetical protein
MFNRFCFGALLFAGVAVSITGCNSSSGLDSIQVTPTAASLVVGGPTLEMTVTGTFGNGSHPSTKPVNTGLTWTSAIKGVATVDASGVVTPVAAGSTTITASAQGFAGTVTSSASITVTGGSGTGTGTGTQTITSIAIIPSSQIIASPPQTAQFIAIGTTSSGGTVDLTSLAAWSSSSAQIATICTVGVTASCPTASPTSYGLATAVGQGTATLTALYTNTSNSTVAQGSASFVVTAGTAETITGVTLLPTSAALTETQTAQIMAIGTNGITGLDNIITSDANLKWVSSLPSVASVCNLGDPAPCTAATVGQIIGVNPGTTSVTAYYTNTDNSVVTAGSAVSVTVSTTAAPEPLLSIKIIPGDTVVSNKGMTGQFLAFGTFSTAPTLQDITNGIPPRVGFGGCTVAPCTKITPVNWISFMPDVASINSSGTTGENGGLATAMGFEGDAVIYATAANPDGTAVLSNPQTFSCKVSPPTPPICEQTPAVPETFVSLTVFNVGENTTTWQITAPDGNGTANLIHCGPGWTGAGGSVCTGTYPYSTTKTVTITETSPGTSFGGWSKNCVTATATTCTVPLTSSASIGAIFY